MPNDEVRTTKRILHIVSSWEQVGAVRRIGMLAAHCNARSCEHHLVALNSRGPDPRRIGRLELPCTALATGRRLGMALAWRLRRLVSHLDADVVHAWSRGAGRMARIGLLGVRGVRTFEAHSSQMPPAIDAARLRGEVAKGISRKQLTQEFGLPSGALLMGAAGRLTREKHVSELLWALDQIRCVRDDVYLLVMGDGESRPLFERYARLYEIAGHVRFLGWRMDAAAIIAELDVYCTASLQAGCSLAMLEAMALGVPVVAADTPANRQVVTNGETGFLVDIRRRSEMARWCLRVLEDEGQARRMSKSSKRCAVERFPVERIVEYCRKLYDET